jgi:ubiquinone/menaquinone biosynthesis C-methylase UbiE
MELQNAIELIKSAAAVYSVGISKWADLGCGDGLFTAALSSLLHEGSTIYAVDRNKRALSKVKSVDGVALEKIEADFIYDELPFSNLDGVLMANSLHFVKNKTAFILKAQGWLNKKSRILLIEYDMDKSNPWVPYPISFHSAENLFKNLGYKTIKKLAELPSLYNRANIYSALIEL